MGQYYAINGSFLLEPALGVQRYAAEILKQMNKMAPAYKECLRLVLVLPETPRIEEIRREFSNIEVRCADKHLRIARPSVAFVALRAVRRNIHKIALLSPQYIVLKLVYQLIGASKAPALLHL